MYTWVCRCKFQYLSCYHVKLLVATSLKSDLCFIFAVCNPKWNSPNTFNCRSPVPDLIKVPSILNACKNVGMCNTVHWCHIQKYCNHNTAYRITNLTSLVMWLNIILVCAFFHTVCLQCLIIDFLFVWLSVYWHISKAAINLTQVNDSAHSCEAVQPSLTALYWPHWELTEDAYWHTTCFI